MMDDSTMQAAAEAALRALRDAGFDQAQASASELAFSELNVADNLPSLLRSSDTRKLALVGIVDGRKAATELADFAPEALQRCVQDLFTDAMAAPADDANAVSSGQQARIVQGPQEPQLDALADGVTRLLELRAATAPRVTLREAECSHVLQRFHTLTSGGSALQGRVGCTG
jgi:PmbA protein